MGRRKSRSRAAAMPAEDRVKANAKPNAKPDAKRPRAQRARADRRVPMARPALDVTRDVALDLTLDAARDAAPSSLLPPVEWSAPPEAEPIAAPSLVPEAAPLDEAILLPPLSSAASQPIRRSPRDTLAAALTVAAVTIVGLGWLAVYIAMVPPPAPIKLVAPTVSAPPPKPFTERLAPSAFGDIDMTAPQAETEAAVKTVPTVVLPRATEPLPPISHKSARAKRHKTRN